MPHLPKLSTGTFVTRLALFYATLFAVFGIQMPFFPIWLEAKGLDASTIGVVLAVPMVVRVLAIVLVTREADRRNALHSALVLGSAVSVVGYGALGFVQGALPILIVFSIVSIAFTPLMPLTDAYALKGLRSRGRAYGPVRLWGSAAFIAVNIAGGLLVDMIAPRNLIWLIVAALAGNVAAALALLPLDRDQEPAGSSPPAGRLLRDPAFLAVVAAASLIQASHAVYYGFSTIDWKSAGLDGLTIGVLWAVGVVAEIVLFALSGRLPPALGPASLLMIGAAGAVIRWTVMAAGPPSWCLVFLQCLHALSYGATHLGTLGLIARLTPDRLGATAQGYLSMVLGLVMAAATGLAGLLYQAYGDLSYAAMALAALAGGAVALVGWRSWRHHARV